jgi:hypothetical protein
VEHLPVTLALVAGVAAFLWSTAVFATALGTYVTDGRLRREEWRTLAIAALAFVTVVWAYWQFAPAPEQLPDRIDVAE